jgi:hypothetical protein
MTFKLIAPGDMHLKVERWTLAHSAEVERRVDLQMHMLSNFPANHAIMTLQQQCMCVIWLKDLCSVDTETKSTIPILESLLYIGSRLRLRAALRIYARFPALVE